jgi:hypothetical protein
VVGLAWANSDTRKQPLLWNNPSGIPTVMTPTNLDTFDESGIIGTDGAEQVGEGDSPQPLGFHALLWNGSVDNVVDLTPTDLPGVTQAVAYGVSNNQQVGYGSVSIDFSANHALLWNGTAASAVDLSPTNISMSSSEALATNGNEQVGYGRAPNSDNNSALLWNGTANSAVNLGQGEAFGISPNGLQVVGQTGLGNINAVLWYGTSHTFVNLNPTSLAGFGNSYAVATNGAQQVGYGVFGFDSDEALVWSGTARSAQNLQNLLPSTGTWISSNAYSIDANGDIFGTAYGTYDGMTGTFSVEWMQSSTPTSVSWNSPADGNWGFGSQWTQLTSPTAATNANFNTGSSTPYTVALTTNASAASLTVQDNVTIQNGGNALVVPGALSITGSASQPASLTLSGAGITTVGSLNISTYGKLDITNTAVVIQYDSNSGSFNPATELQIRNYIKNGFDGGSWDGGGSVNGAIVSSVAAEDASSGEPYGGDSAIGYADNNDLGNSSLPTNSVLVRFTYYGDADLNGVVNLNDFDDWLYGYTGGLGTAGDVNWSVGDFDYDGYVTLNDFDLWLASYTSGNGSLGTLDHAIDASTLSTSQKTELLGIVSSVPEPASFSFLAGGSIALLGRRRRRVE